MTSARYPAALRVGPSPSRIDASVVIPGSKSITNRALLIAALAQGESRLRSPLESDDTQRMTDCLRALGVSIQEDGDDLVVNGKGGSFDAPAQTLFVGNSGTTVRMLAATACLAPEGTTVVLDGIERMRHRPIGDLTDALRELEVDIVSTVADGYPPIAIRGGGLPGGTCRIKGDVSSQYLTALLLAAPYAHRDVDIEIVGLLTSKPYVDITTAMMREFGVIVDNDSYSRFLVPGRQRYIARDYTVEADASNATYFLAAAAVTGGRVTVENLAADALQGDARFVDVLEQMGCRISRGSSLTVEGPKALKAIDVDMADMPDAAMTLAVVCAFADGVSRLSGLSNLRVKETDRIHAIAAELRKLGVGVQETHDGWQIQPAVSTHSTAAIDTYDDHRMAMSFAVASLRAPGLVINDPGCVAKTFPDFWDRWKAAFGAMLTPV